MGEQHTAGPKRRQRMSYAPVFHAEGHDEGCGAHLLEPCDCASGIVAAVSLAFRADLERIARAALNLKGEG